MSPHTGARIRMAVLLIVGILAQTTIAADVRVDGVAPDLMLLLAICGGMAGGRVPGALIGFSAGLLADLFLTDTPLGLSALAWCLVGFGVGWLRSNVLHEGRLLVPVIAFVATGAGLLAFVGIGDLVGQSQLLIGGRSWLLRVIVIESLWSLLLSWPLSRLFGWAARGSEGVAELGGGRTDRVALR